LSEREEIRAGIERGEPLTVVAVRLGRHRCTISEEVARNGGRGAYRAASAQERADEQLCRPKATRLEGDPVLAAHVEARLRAKDSPMTIAVELDRGLYPGLGGATVSHETIYAAIHAQGRRGLPKGLHAGLHRRRRCRKHRPAPGQDASKGNGPLGEFNLIGTRPAEANGRDVVGHLEGDLIIGAFNRSAIVTVFDRASRYLWLADLPEGHGADAVLGALIEVVDRMPVKLQLSLTWDQGREMAAHDLLTAATGIDVYFAEPHSPWQRPTNENGNGLIRRYVGKGTNLGAFTDADLRGIEHRINTMPRRSLNWATAHDHYTSAASR
ncbi:IS30 family transposase, partial [Iamia sp.]|uniref:IS30 family transposase n=1 Tax=Iamia sp. TaxID=2722710 RepID=UPI002CC78C68